MEEIKYRKLEHYAQCEYCTNRNPPLLVMELGDEESLCCLSCLEGARENILYLHDRKKKERIQEFSKSIEGIFSPLIGRELYGFNFTKNAVEFYVLNSKDDEYFTYSIPRFEIDEFVSNTNLKQKGGSIITSIEVSTTYDLKSVTTRIVTKTGLVEVEWFHETLPF